MNFIDKKFNYFWKKCFASSVIFLFSFFAIFGVSLNNSSRNLLAESANKINSESLYNQNTQNINSVSTNDLLNDPGKYIENDPNYDIYPTTFSIKNNLSSNYTPVENAILLDLGEFTSESSQEYLWYQFSWSNNIYPLLIDPVLVNNSKNKISSEYSTIGDLSYKNAQYVIYDLWKEELNLDLDQESIYVYATSTSYFDSQYITKADKVSNPEKQNNFITNYNNQWINKSSIGNIYYNENSIYSYQEIYTNQNNLEFFQFLNGEFNYDQSFVKNKNTLDIHYQKNTPNYSDTNWIWYLQANEINSNKNAIYYFPPVNIWSNPWNNVNLDNYDSDLKIDTNSYHINPSIAKNEDIYIDQILLYSNDIFSQPYVHTSGTEIVVENKDVFKYITDISINTNSHSYFMNENFFTKPTYYSYYSDDVYMLGFGNQYVASYNDYLSLNLVLESITIELLGNNNQIFDGLSFVFEIDKIRTPSSFNSDISLEINSLTDDSALINVAFTDSKKELVSVEVLDQNNEIIFIEEFSKFQNNYSIYLDNLNASTNYDIKINYKENNSEKSYFFSNLFITPYAKEDKYILKGSAKAAVTFDFSSSAIIMSDDETEIEYDLFLFWNSRYNFSDIKSVTLYNSNEDLNSNGEIDYSSAASLTGDMSTFYFEGLLGAQGLEVVGYQLVMKNGIQDVNFSGFKFGKTYDYIEVEVLTSASTGDYETRGDYEKVRWDLETELNQAPVVVFPQQLTFDESRVDLEIFNVDGKGAYFKINHPVIKNLDSNIIYNYINKLTLVDKQAANQDPSDPSHPSVEFTQSSRWNSDNDVNDNGINEILINFENLLFPNTDYKIYYNYAIDYSGNVGDWVELGEVQTTSDYSTIAGSLQLSSSDENSIVVFVNDITDGTFNYTIEFKIDGITENIQGNNNGWIPSGGNQGDVNNGIYQLDTGDILNIGTSYVIQVRLSFSDGTYSNIVEGLFSTASVPLVENVEIDQINSSNTSIALKVEVFNPSGIDYDLEYAIYDQEGNLLLDFFTVFADTNATSHIIVIDEINGQPLIPGEIYRIVLRTSFNQEFQYQNIIAKTSAFLPEYNGNESLIESAITIDISDAILIIKTSQDTELDGNTFTNIKITINPIYEDSVISNINFVSLNGDKFSATIQRDPFQNNIFIATINLIEVPNEYIEFEVFYTINFFGDSSSFTVTLADLAQEGQIDQNLLTISGNSNALSLTDKNNITEADVDLQRVNIYDFAIDISLSLTNTLTTITEVQVVNFYSNNVVYYSYKPNTPINELNFLDLDNRKINFVFKDNDIANDNTVFDIKFYYSKDYSNVNTESFVVSESFKVPRYLPKSASDFKANVKINTSDYVVVMGDNPEDIEVQNIELFIQSPFSYYIEEYCYAAYSCANNYIKEIKLSSSNLSNANNEVTIDRNGIVSSFVNLGNGVGGLYTLTFKFGQNGSTGTFVYEETYDILEVTYLSPIQNGFTENTVIYNLNYESQEGTPPTPIQIGVEPNTFKFYDLSAWNFELKALSESAIEIIIDWPEYSNYNPSVPTGLLYSTTQDSNNATEILSSDSSWIIDPVDPTKASITISNLEASQNYYIFVRTTQNYTQNGPDNKGLPGQGIVQYVGVIKTQDILPSIAGFELELESNTSVKVTIQTFDPGSLSLSYQYRLNDGPWTIYYTWIW